MFLLLLSCPFHIDLPVGGIKNLKKCAKVAYIADFINFVVIEIKTNHRFHNLHANFVKNLDECKCFSTNLVNELGKLPQPGVVPKFCNLEVIALNLAAENMSIDSQNYQTEILR